VGMVDCGGGLHSLRISRSIFRPSPRISDCHFLTNCGGEVFYIVNMVCKKVLKEECEDSDG
jgi:hypothetical protein